MQKVQFIHKISKGSSFNQIYIPRGMEKVFEVGDLVEVKLLGKKVELHYSQGLPKLSEFKEKLIKEIFAFLPRFKEIKQVFIVGSFLTGDIDYKDIDIVLISNEKNIEESAYNKLSEKFGLKFHVISMPEGQFLRLMTICPLTKSMFYYNISNKKAVNFPKREIDVNHIKFLLMMPEDILEIKISGRAYYDCLRRLIAIEKFLDKKDEDPKKINLEVKKLVGEVLLIALKNNEIIEGKALDRIKNIIKKKLDLITKRIKNGKD